RWNGQYFKKIILRDLGIALQLGHPARKICCSSAIGLQVCMVIHISDLHLVTLLFCGCNQLSHTRD
ncbi:uncharacterized protein PHACADRAFT_97859, partial [Phanerochaete carnosa HHB-10118-sp]